MKLELSFRSDILFRSEFDMELLILPLTQSGQFDPVCLPEALGLSNITFFTLFMCRYFFYRESSTMPLTQSGQFDPVCLPRANSSKYHIFLEGHPVDSTTFHVLLLYMHIFCDHYLSRTCFVDLPLVQNSRALRKASVVAALLLLVVMQRRRDLRIDLKRIYTKKRESDRSV